MPTTRGQWTIYGKSEVTKGYDDAPWLHSEMLSGSDNLPAEGWTMSWEEVFDSTEFAISDLLTVGLLTEDWKGHKGGSVAVENWTTGELAIWRGLRNVVEITQKKGEDSDGTS